MVPNGYRKAYYKITSETPSTDISTCTHKPAWNKYPNTINDCKEKTTYKSCLFDRCEALG